MRFRPLLLAVALSGAAAPAPAQAPAEILLLGLYHFANPGLDLVRNEVADVLAPDRQAQIEEIVASLARFRPTRIGVEQRTESAGWLDSTYRAYRAGRHSLSRNETEQIGYRLAARLGHPRVYPIDAPGEFPFDSVMAYAAVHDSSFITWSRTALAAITAEENRRQALSIAGNLRLRNDPADIAGGLAFYRRTAAVGAGDSYVGANLVGKWYTRNARIFANIRRLASPGERVVVLIGSGHLGFLRELIGGDPQLRLANTLEYLPAP